MSSTTNLATCRKLGFIVPSSNTAVEPTTNAIFSTVQGQEVLCLYTRIPVTSVGTDVQSTSQFSMETMVAAAKLLADAKVEGILWNGTSGMWVGTSLRAEQAIADEMERSIGLPCSTTTIATIQALTLTGNQVKRIGIAVPYSEALTKKLVQFYTSCGFEVVKTARMEKTPGSNNEIAQTGMEEIRDVVRRADGEKVEAIVVACTNWPAAPIVQQLEKETGKLVIDSIAVTAWGGLGMLQISSGVKGWGRLLESCDPSL